MMLLVCGKIDSCRRERRNSFIFFSFVRSVEFAYVFAWFTADSGHSFVRYSFQEIHLVNCDFQFCFRWTSMFYVQVSDSLTML